jgi:hypothetical protein
MGVRGEAPQREERQMAQALVIEARFTSYYTGEFMSESEVFAEAATLEAAILFAQDCDADGGFDFTNDEPDWEGDVKRQTRSYYAVDAAVWGEQQTRERREREEALLPFGSEWYAERAAAGGF